MSGVITCSKYVTHLFGFHSVATSVQAYFPLRISKLCVASYLHLMPAGAKAKARTKARAKPQVQRLRPVKSLRQGARRQAVRSLNGLISEVQLAAPHLPSTTAARLTLHDVKPPK